MAVMTFLIYRPPFSPSLSAPRDHTRTGLSVVRFFSARYTCTHARTHAFAFSRSLDSYRPRRLLRLSLLRLLLYTLPYFLRPVYITRDAYAAKYRVREESPRQGQLNNITRFSIFLFFFTRSSLEISV